MAAPVADPAAASKIDEYRGSNNWTGLLPAVEEPRVWDEGFRSFLLKYGMFNQMVYDVFILRKERDKKTEKNLRCRSRFGEDLKEFSQKGLKFSYVNQEGEKKQEYDFTNDYSIISNIICRPGNLLGEEGNWFGFIGLSKDNKEMVIVFRGTETIAEWIETAKCFLEKLDGERAEKGRGFRIHNRSILQCHSGFQELYRERTQHFLSPQDQIYHTINNHTTNEGKLKDTLEKVTVVGHSLGGAMCQHCAVDLAHSKILGDVPILGLAWAAPRIGNSALSDWVKKQPNLRILRITIPIDTVCNLPPEWFWGVFSGSYKHLGTEISLSNTHLHKQGLVKDDDGNSPNHNLEQYLHTIDPTREVALMNKIGTVIPDKYCQEHHISPAWHSLTFPRTIYN